MVAVETEVAVLGSGLAGLSAALTARRRGKDVVLLADPDATPASSLSGGSFRSAAPAYTPERHFLDTLAAGHYLSQRSLARALAQDAPRARAFVEAAGVATADKDTGFEIAGTEAARGRSLVQALKAAAEKAGIRFVAALGWELLLDDRGAVAGILAYGSAAADWLVVSAPAVIVASGGAAGLYFRTDNSVDATGDGMAMAFRAGAVLADMEFVQFWPLAAIDPSPPSGYATCPGLTLGEISRGRLTTGAGKEVTGKVGLRGVTGGAAESARVARLLYEEAGCAAGPGEEQELLLDGRRVTPAAHHTMGGVVCGDHGQTRVPGLFVAGEVAAGTHGAGRLSGNGLAEALAMGARAGTLAASEPVYPAQRREPPTNAELERQARDRVRRTLGLLEARDGSGLSPDEVRTRIALAMWTHAALVRTRESLDAAQSEINKVKRALPLSVDTKNGPEVRAGLKALNTLLVAEAIARSARYRKESRGVHFRSDFAAQDDAEWLRHVRVRLLSGEMSLDVSPGLDLMEP